MRRLAAMIKFYWYLYTYVNLLVLTNLLIDQTEWAMKLNWHNPN